MQCPHCQAAQTSERVGRTELGYRRFRCRTCGRESNERTGTPSRADSAEGRRPSTGPEKGHVLRFLEKDGSRREALLG
jgi:transposase-like protein